MKLHCGSQSECSQSGHCEKRDEDIPGLTDCYCASLPGAKEASGICKLFSLSKEDDVCQYVLRKPLNKEGKIIYW